MRILYLTQWFEPEPNIIKGLAFVHALEAAGHDVTVVTGFPNYPSGRLYPGYRLRPIRRETIAGVRVIRLPLYPSHDTSAVRRSLNFLSFFVSALVYLLCRRARFDIAYVYHPPITVGLAAALAGHVRTLPFLLDIQDLWPDTLAATGMVGAGRLTVTVGLLCRFVYRRAAMLIAQSDGMRRALIGRGVPADKISTIRNWATVECEGVAESERAGRCCSIVYGGNLGRAQALETVIDAAAILGRTHADVEILLYGDGTEAESLRRRAAKVATVRFLGRVDRDEMSRVFARADALLLHLRDDPLFAITIPSKIQAYLAAGRPIVAGIAGEAAAMLRDAGAAFVVPPQDAPALARAIADIADLSAAERRAMGEAGRLYYRKHLSFAQAMDRTLALLRETCAGAPERAMAS